MSGTTKITITPILNGFNVCYEGRDGRNRKTKSERHYPNIQSLTKHLEYFYRDYDDHRPPPDLS